MSERASWLGWFLLKHAATTTSKLMTLPLLLSPSVLLFLALAFSVLAECSNAKERGRRQAMMDSEQRGVETIDKVMLPFIHIHIAIRTL